MIRERVVIVMGSEADLEHSKKIKEVLDEFNMENSMEIASAHKNTAGLLKIIEDEDIEKGHLIYIAVAGRSNALGGVIDGNTLNPVINCPPPSEKFAGLDILSSLRMPSDIACATILEPEAAALFAVKIFALENRNLAMKLLNYKREKQKSTAKNDKI